ncbi:Sec23/Sec24 trunk domain-containing protein [Cokeromyces recurvatus]|uniref:Sec23/Sec24 trunk domain-containing protein n=1 Tax=Cokeromyces recurvatus TaxID=90255 RepID=UPI002220DFA1|nr:Sec23/Sec24 trunk domain-containing protein [Cokeromyces recurvatus]KAI7898044.1 Sec23/Sec24 trunk domain-containing protein [Cokeromyces recurvatus]
MMNYNNHTSPSYNVPSQPSPSSPLNTQQFSPQMESKRTKRHYPRLQAQEIPTVSSNLGYPQPSFQQAMPPFQQAMPPFQQQNTLVQPQNPSYQQPQVMSSFIASNSFQQQLQPQPSTFENGYNQALNGIENISINQQPSLRQDVPLVGQPPLIQDLHQEISLPQIPPNFTATGSPSAQVNAHFNYATVNSFPYSNSLHKKSKVPLALILQPYLQSDAEKINVPVVPDTVVTRCTRCKTYINPFVQFTTGALKWKCNMCDMENDVPQAFDWDIINQQKTDRYSRAELNYGCVDFIAPAEYIVRPPQPPVYVFVIDTSFQAAQTGMIHVVADAILNALDKIPNEDGRAKVGFITVDNAVGFYKLLSSDNEPEILVVGDLQDMYLPRAASELIVNLVESRATIENLLTKMKTMYSNSHSPSNCLGSALQAARKLLSPTGGKIICFQASIPNVGEGIIKAKADGGKSVVDIPLMTASNGFYKTFAGECTKLQICADMFIFGGNQSSDVATLNVIPRFTGGQTHFFPGFNAATHPEDCLKLKEEVVSLLSEEVGLEAVMRTRCSQGIVCHAFFGNCTTRIPDIMALPNVPRDQSYCIELAIEEEIKSNFVYFQTALLYTTCFGERRIRVMNLCLPVTKSISELYASVNQVALARTLCHQALDKGANSKLRDARDYLSKSTIDIFVAYSKEVMGISSANAQLTVCRPLSLLPLLILGILKSEAFNDAPILADTRSQSAILLRTLPTRVWTRYVHPNFYSLHNMPQMAGILDNQTGQITMPPETHLSSEKLETHGCYLLENGQAIYIWIGKNAVPQLCKDLLGVASIADVKSGQIIMLPRIKSAISERVSNIIQYLQTKRKITYYPTIYIVKEDGDPLLRSRFLNHLLEDRQPTGPNTAGANQQNVSSGMSYFQWLGYVRSKCQS